MRTWSGPALLLLLLCAIPACGPGGATSPDPVELPPPEVFNWGGQPISVSPPPEDWYRDKAQQGGLRGVRFIKSGSVGEEIRLAEHYALDERDRCERLTALLSDLDNLDRLNFQQAIQLAKLYRSPPINDRETRLAALANAKLDRARKAFLEQRSVDARTAVARAYEYATRIQYTLDEVVGRVMFSAESYDSFGKVEVQEPVEGRLGGEASVSVDFTLDSTDRGCLYQGRQVYVLKNNRLFVMTYLGLPQNLPLFEQILETISFPEGACTH